jgi:hypothetical protein
MPTELLIGLIGFGTATVGLVAAYISRTRHVIHRHEHVPHLVKSDVPVDRTSDVPVPVAPTSTLALDAGSNRPEIDLDVETPDDEEFATDPSESGEGTRGRTNKYAFAALRAVELIRAVPGRLTPPDAWEVATTEVFGSGTPAQKKGCPKGTFLGLCQVGYVIGIPSGDYTRSEKNREYAVSAAEALADDPTLDGNAEALWNRVLSGEHKRHNSQMHVVIALWKQGLLTTGRPVASRS